MRENFNQINSVLMMAHSFLEKDGVGALRSRTLCKFLKEKKIECDVLNHSNFNFTIFQIFKKIFSSKHDIIYLSCGPFNFLFFVSFFCFIFRKKLVVDFRDAWSLNILTNYGCNAQKSSKSLKYFISVFIEKITYLVCYKFIVCTNGMHLKYSKVFNDSSKLILIENGYDFQSNDKKIIFNNKLSFICIGKFAEYDYEKAKKTIKKILKNNPNVEFNFVASNEEKNKILLQELGFDGVVNFFPRMPYEDAISLAKKCDIGLLVIRDEEIDYGTKIFDYIGLGMPFFSDLDESKDFFNIFNIFLFDFNKGGAIFSNTDIEKNSRVYRYESFKGILY